MANETDYVELGLVCANVCRALDRGMNGKKLRDLSQPVWEAINELTTWVRPVTQGLGSSLTILFVVEPWRRSKRRSSNRGGGMQSLDSFTRRMTRKLSPLGS